MDVDGLELSFRPPGDAEQFEGECILIRLLAPAASIGLASLVEGLAEELVKIARDVAVDEAIAVEGDEVPKPWDLARLLSLRDLDSSDPRLRAAWDAFLDQLPKVLGDALVNMTPQASDRLDFKDILRLREIYVDGKVMVVIDGKPTRIPDYGALGRPSLKWQILIAAIADLYFGPNRGVA